MYLSNLSWTQRNWIRKRKKVCNAGKYIIPDYGAILVSRDKHLGDLWFVGVRCLRLDFSPEIGTRLFVRTLIAIIACSVNFRCGYYPQRGPQYPINMRFFASLIYFYRKQNCLHSVRLLAFRLLRFYRYHYIIFLVNHIFINYYCAQLHVLLCLKNE